MRVMLVIVIGTLLIIDININQIKVWFLVEDFMGLTINPNWRKENLKCYFCGETRSVKYKTKVIIIDTFPNDEESKKEVCVCNKCALLMNNIK